MKRTMIGGWTLALALVATASVGNAESYDVDGAKIRVVLRTQWIAAMVGEPFYVSLTIENLSSRDLYYINDGAVINRHGRRAFTELKVLDEEGQVLEVPDSRYGFGGRSGVRTLSPGARDSTTLFVPEFARITKPGAHTLLCQRTFRFLKARDSMRPSAHVLVADAKTSITIDAYDSKRMPAIIRRLGRGLLDSGHIRALASIDDPRVLPELRRGIASGRLAVMWQCVRACVKFDDDFACECIKSALDTKASDIKNVPDRQAAEKQVAEVRRVAASALSESRSPRALKVLRTLAADAQHRIRVIVLRRFGKRARPEDVALVREMAIDKHEAVRAEAARLLKSLEEK